MCGGPAEVRHQPIAEILSDVSVVPRHHVPASLSIRAHQVAEFLGIEALGEGSGSHDIAEHDRELAPLSAANSGGIIQGRSTMRDWHSLATGLRKCLDGNNQATARPDGEPELIDVGFRELWQHIERDLVLGEHRSVLPKSESVQPRSDVVHVAPQISSRTKHACTLAMPQPTVA